MFYGYAIYSKATARKRERSDIFNFSGLSLSRRSSSENLTRFTKIEADILITFAYEFFTEEIEDTESL